MYFIFNLWKVSAIDYFQVFVPYILWIIIIWNFVVFLHLLHNIQTTSPAAKDPFGGQILHGNGQNTILAYASWVSSIFGAGKNYATKTFRRALVQG